MRYDLAARAGQHGQVARDTGNPSALPGRDRIPGPFGPGFSLFMPSGGEFVVGAGVHFRRNFTCEIGPDGRVEIGPGTDSPRTCSFSAQPS